MSSTHRLVFSALIVLAWIAGIAIDASAVPQAPPPLPTAPEIAAGAVVKFEDSVTKAEVRIDVLADRGVFRIERAILKGASDESIQKTARKAKGSFPGQARKALAQINRDLGSAIIQMRTAVDYTPELEDDLRFERETSIAELEDAIAAANLRIDEAAAGGSGE